MDKTQTKTLREAQDFVEIWDQIQSLRTLLRVEEDVLLDPVQFLASTDDTRRSCSVACWRGQKLIGVMYLMEHFIKGFGSGYAIGGDYSGRGLLLSRSEDETLVLKECVRQVFASGIHSLHLRFLPTNDAKIAVKGLKMKFLDATIPGDRLEFTAPFDGFLGTMGKHTRRNVRAFTRKTEEAGIRFVPNLTKEEYDSAVERLNAETFFRADALRLARDERLMTLRGGGQRLGLRAQDGTLIAVLCGFSKGERFHLLTQLNDMNYEKFSLSLVLRSYVFKHLIETGHTQLQFMGGSSLTFGRYCVPEMYRSIFIDRKTGLAAISKQICSNLVKLISQMGRPVPEFLTVLSSGHLDDSRLSERTALRPAAMLFQQRRIM